MRASPHVSGAPWPREEGRKDFQIILIVCVSSPPKDSDKRVRKVPGVGSV